MTSRFMYDGNNWIRAKRTDFFQVSMFYAIIILLIDYMMQWHLNIKYNEMANNVQIFQTGGVFNNISQ